MLKVEKYQSELKVEMYQECNIYLQHQICSIAFLA